jgi:hypothetical protein
MNDPVVERVAREDPVRHGPALDRAAPADATLQRVLAAIDANNGDSLRGSRSESPSFVAGPPRRRHIANRPPAGGVGLVAAVLVVAAIVVVALVTLGRHHVVTGPATHPRPTGGGAAVRAVPAGSVKVGSGPADLLVADGSLWVAGHGYVARLNPADGREQAKIPVPANVIGPAQLAAGAGSIWVAYQGQGQVQRIDPNSDRVIATIGLRGAPSGGGIAVAGGHVWVSIASQSRRGHVLVIDPHADRVSGPAAAVGTGPGRLDAGLGSVWVQNTSGPNATASRIDPATGAVQQLSITGDPMVGFGHVWVLGAPFGRGPTALYRYTPGARPAYLPGARFTRGLAVTFGAGRVWVLSSPRSTSTFHPIRGTAAVTPVAPRPYRYGLPVGTPTRLDALQPDAIAVAGRDLWVADFASGELLHFQIR